MDMSNLFKAVRDALDITQVEMAAKLGVTQANISKIEQGAEPTASTYIKMTLIAPDVDPVTHTFGELFKALKDEIDKSRCNCCHCNGHDVTSSPNSGSSLD